jgi:LemA protein
MIALTCAAVALIYLVWARNRLVAHRNRVRNAWAQIDVQLRRRGELVPNLVACVKGYVAHESQVLNALVEIRRQISAAGSNVTARGMAENDLARSLHTVLSTAEAVPQLQASQNFLMLQEELRSTENRIAFARQHYNDSVMQYNVALSTLPTNLVARLFSFSPAAMFAARDAGVDPVSLGGSPRVSQ